MITHLPAASIPLSEDNGDVCDDHYHRYMEDIEKLEFLGVNAYRFSISWPRILPRGRFGEVNPSGIKFYNKLIDNLLLRGIEPFVTIHHYDFPQELEERYGSWLSPQMQEDFLLFAKICFEYFGDRVKKWATINAPNIYVLMAYKLGVYPPKRTSLPYENCSPDVQALIAVHNMLIAHAKAAKLYREQFQPTQGGTIGIAVSAFHYKPYTDDEFGYQAVERAYAFSVAWMVDPFVYGDYPSLMRKYIGNDLPKFSKDEVELLKGSMDFVGINHYTSYYAIDCLHSSNCTVKENSSIQGFVGAAVNNSDGIPIGEEMGVYDFRVVPEGMEKLVNYVSTRYPNTTIYVTENGYCPPKNQIESEMVDDLKRIKYHEDYLMALARAIRKGAKVEGYFAWTLLDDYEWLLGYDRPFGLYSVNRTTLERSPRESAKWYANFLRNGGISNISSF